VSAADVERRPLATVCVVSGPGLADVSRSLGAQPLRGGKTTNPSVEEILRAIESAPGDAVIVLPNDKDITPASERAAGEAKKAVRVVPTRSIAQGLAALVAFDAHGDLDAVAAAMLQAARRAKTLEVTRAARSTTIDGIAVREGEHIALLDGRCVGCAPTSDAALRLGAQAVGSAELCTVYLGADVDGGHRETASAVLEEEIGCAVEVVKGGQPHYPYIVAAE
jgi:dihydroxyacetone kinase-like predicted kinase